MSELPVLAARAQLGDRAALEALLRGLQSPLGDHLRALLRDDDLAADALQETLILICRKLGNLREPEWVRAWAYRVATRVGGRAARRAHLSREVQVDEMDGIAAAAPDESAFTREQIATLLADVGALPAATQVVVRMHYLQELTQQEIAAALEIPLGTVKSRLAYGLTRLRARGRGR